MKSFLNIVAKDLLEKYGTNLSDVTIVFPNKRASLFLNEELIMQSDNKPVWSPKYTTICELFRDMSDLIIADQIKLVCELHKHYSAITKSDESLDDFYGWGELMLADFDDLDKNMGKADNIFKNISEIHQYDNNDYLTKEQMEIIKRFFNNVSDNGNSILKQNFIKLWNNLGNIYKTFRNTLREKGIAYEGMLYRDVAESLSEGTTLKSKKYIFVGFNLIQKAEQSLFEFLSREGKAAFYWDFDEYYIKNNNEAGRFIKTYLDKFPNEIEYDDNIYKNFTNGKNITYVSASSEDVQARYISQWLTQERIDAGKRTAIVMCDEKLLPTIINSLPDTVKDINITTGYPMAQTHIATLVKLVFEMIMRRSVHNKRNLRLHNINQVLHHPYMKYFSDKSQELYDLLNKKNIFYPTYEDLAIDEHLGRLFAPPSPEEDKDNKSRCLYFICTMLYLIKRIAKCSDEFEKDKKVKESREMQLTQESLYRMHQIFTRLNTLIESDDLCIDMITLHGLINQIIRSTNVPFHGEPIMGIQVMGVLETRNLDFDHMLILSANEGNMPKSVNDASFIPHAIRKAYELTTIENKVSIYAYYFHRMMQRASDVNLTYNNTSNESKTCEMSRFMMQLLAEYPHKINKLSLTSNLQVGGITRTPIEKTADVIEKMNSKDIVSPSAIANYLRCPMSYFYKDVCGINDNDNTDEEELDKRVFGLIFHKTAEILYSNFIGKTVTKSDIEKILNSKTIIEDALNEAFKEELFLMKDEKIKDRKMPKLSGAQLISKNIVESLIKTMLKYDKEHCPIHIVDLEKKIMDKITFHTDYGPKTLNVKGFIDRLDIVTDKDGIRKMRVIDYKTSSKEASATDIDSLFEEKESKGNKNTHYYIQTMMYCKMLSEPEDSEPQSQDLPVVPALFYPHKCKPIDEYSPILSLNKEPINDIRDYSEEFTNKLKYVLSDIWDYSKPFTPTSDIKKCNNCYFSSICGQYK